jgi:hypothetical protein
VRRPKKGNPPTHTDEQYLELDPGAGDRDVDIQCRRTKLVITKAEHTCFGIGAGKQHSIPIGARVFRESAKVDGQFGTCYVCLPCADFMLEPDYW